MVAMLELDSAAVLREIAEQVRMRRGRDEEETGMRKGREERRENVAVLCIEFTV